MFFSSNNCIEKNQNKTHFEEGSSSLSYQSKGSVPLSNQMNYWKGSKRQLTPTPSPSQWSPSLEIMYKHAFHTT